MMNQASGNAVRPRRPAMIWTGRVISAVIGLGFIASAIMKFAAGPEAKEGLDHLGLSMDLIIPLAILEITCAVIYLVPATSVLGAILLTGYMGGAICTHMRVGDLFVVQTIMGVLVWLGLFLREERLRAILPIRTRGAGS